MKSLINFINEEISGDKLDTLKQYITDDNFNDILTLVKRYNIKHNTNPNYDKYFDDHGLSKLKISGSLTVKDYIIGLFIDNDKQEILDDIVSKPGIIKINELGELAGKDNGLYIGNIFNYCDGWIDIAKEIAKTKPQNKTVIGSYEILLRFMIDGASSGDKGDVFFINSKSEMEVKTTTYKGTPGVNKSGGRSAGIKNEIKYSKDLYNRIYELLKNNKQLKNIEKNDYFSNEKSVKDFIRMINNNANYTNDIINVICKSLCFQYNLNKNELSNLTNKILTYIQKENIINENNPQKFINVIGFIQLYLYQKVEEFNYFISLLLNKSDEENKQNIPNGNFVFISDINLLSDINIILKYFDFSYFGKENSSFSRTGKIFLKYKND